MSTILNVSTVNNGEYKTVISGQSNPLNDKDYQSIEKVLASTTIKRDGNTILSKDSIENVLKTIEDGGDYYDEYTDPLTNNHQLTPSNTNQGKTAELRQS